MQDRLEKTGDEAYSVLDVPNSMKGVKVTSAETEKRSNEEYILEVKGAVEEISLAKSGKAKLKTFDELLSEIENIVRF